MSWTNEQRNRCLEVKRSSYQPFNAMVPSITASNSLTSSSCAWLGQLADLNLYIDFIRPMSIIGVIAAEEK